MGEPFGKPLAFAAVSVAAAICSAAAQGSEAHAAPGASSEDEVVVVGRIGDLRRQLWLAEEAVYDRFNAINSDDEFDIHCRWQRRAGSRIVERRCVSNAWRRADGFVGAAFIDGLGGSAFSTPVSVARAQQLYDQRRLVREMKQLLVEDEELRQANLRLVSAQLALSGETRIAPVWSEYRQVEPGDDGLPFDARRLFEVRMGRDTWSHLLEQRTFTIADVSGDIQTLHLDCEQGSTRFEYRPEVDWTVPSTWSNCAVRVKAKRDTTFRLYEFLAARAGAEIGL